MGEPSELMRGMICLVTAVVTGVVLAAVGWYASAGLVAWGEPLWGRAAVVLARLACTIIPGFVGAVAGALAAYMIVGRRQGTVHKS